MQNNSKTAEQKGQQTGGIFSVCIVKKINYMKQNARVCMFIKFCM